MSHHSDEGHQDSRHPVVTGPGSDGQGSDSPIIITAGSCHIVSINDDFRPTATRSSTTYTIFKSNGGAAVIQPGANKANAVKFTIALQDSGAANSMTIVGTPTPVAAANGIGAYYNWTIVVTVVTGTDSLTRFDMNGGESRVSHPFSPTSGTVAIGGGNPTSIGTHISIHFR